MEECLKDEKSINPSAGLHSPLDPNRLCGEGGDRAKQSAPGLLKWLLVTCSALVSAFN